MQDNIFLFIFVMAALTAITTIVLTWMNIRAKTKSSTGSIEPRREIELLTDENAGLKGQVGRLEERLAVLERIATDPAERTAREIEQLRQS